MAQSKNDFSCCGGTARLVTHPVRGRQDASYLLIDPATSCPYTNADLAAALQQRKKEQPILGTILETELAEIEEKARHAPDAFYRLTCRAESKEAAKARAQKELLPRLECVAKLLFRPQWESNIEIGNVTVAQFVHYLGRQLYPNVSDDTRAHLLSSLHAVILPAIGRIHLRELDTQTQEKAIRRINRALNQKKAGASQRGYTKRAYKGLFTAIEGSGYSHCLCGIRLADMIDQVHRKNRSLMDSVRTSHLDESQRSALFALLTDGSCPYEAFLVSMIYSGLDAAEIAGLKFDDIDELVLHRESCYVITVTKMVRKLDKRYSTLSASNDSFPIQRLRKIVLYPWAAEILQMHIQHLRTAGYTDQQIANMRLSDSAPNSSITGPAEIAASIESLLVRAGISHTAIPRTRKDGSVYMQTEPPSIALLYLDAQYIASECCGANPVMLHAMFGLPWTETDEEAYLDLLSDSYAVARYQRLRRFSPLYPVEWTRSVFEVENNTAQPTELNITSDYAIIARWRECHEKCD